MEENSRLRERFRCSRFGNFGSTGSLSHELSPLHPDPPNHALTPNVAKSKPYWLGGISAIAISHPHYYTGMAEWSRVFDCPIHLHAADRQWVTRPNAQTEFWDGEVKVLENGLTLIRCGGHFDGGAVLHWAAGANGKGAILSGDILQVVQDRRWLSFMYSYPNFIPLPVSAINRIVAAVEPFEYDRIYGAFPGKVVPTDAKQAVKLSAERYIQALKEPD